MATAYLTYLNAVTKFYGSLTGRHPAQQSGAAKLMLGPRPDEARHRRENDTDGSRRRADETKHRHQMH